MEVSGYIVRFCETKSCPHSSRKSCPNATDSKYYINPEVNLNIKGVPLVVAHNSKFVIGKCIFQIKTTISLYLRCIIDDVYFLECLRRRFDDYKDNYNSDITFETFCKKTLSSFSLSHEVNTGVIRHISLVDTPGRQGTTVDYKKNLNIVLVRRLENQFISDIIATHSAAYLTTADRTEYLLKSTSLSHNPTDVCYINASRNMDYQDQFHEATEIYKILKSLKANKDTTAPSNIKPIKRTRDDDDNDENTTENSNKKTKRDDLLTQPMIVEAMKNGIQEGITAAMEIIKQPQQQPTGIQPEVVDAGRARPTITINPNEDICKMIVQYIMGEKNKPSADLKKTPS